MPLYKVDVLVPFTVEAESKQHINQMVKKIKWKMIFNQLRALRFVPVDMKYRNELMRYPSIKKIKETGIG